MNRTLALACLLLLAAAWIATTSPSRATIQEDDCIDPAIEYPIPCDEDDGD